MAELTQSILKSKRRNKFISSSENLHEEFVDVKIVMAQIELCLDHEKLKFWKNEKLIRLNTLIINHNERI